MGRPSTEELVLLKWDDLVEVTTIRGHRLGIPEQDTDVSLVSECDLCQSLFAVDGEERPYLFGPITASCGMVV